MFLNKTHHSNLYKQRSNLDKTFCVGLTRHSPSREPLCTSYVEHMSLFRPLFVYFRPFDVTIQLSIEKSV